MDNHREHLQEQTLAEFDKTTWRAGKDEPDRVEWRYKGVPCLLLRSPATGAWCGYAGTAEGHPWFGNGDTAESDVRVHGGVTLATMCDGRICHVARPGEPEHVFWIGFDCSHGFDFSPGLDAQLRDGRFCAPGEGLFLHTTYRDQAYAMAEAEAVAEQILAVVR